MKPARLPAQGDHRAWLAYWSQQMLRAIAAHAAGAVSPAGSPWDMEQEHAVRAARMCHYHALRVKPALRYDKEGGTGT